jgi:hypothetical protein
MSELITVINNCNNGNFTHIRNAIDSGYMSADKLLSHACAVYTNDNGALITYLVKECNANPMRRETMLMYGLSPFYIACINEKRRCVKAFLSLGVDVNHPSEYDSLGSLDRCLNRPKCAHLLMDHGARLLRSELNEYEIERYAYLRQSRHVTRTAALALLGALAKGQPKRSLLDRNVSQIIGQWVWTTRGF